MKSVVRIRYKNEKPQYPVWFNHRTALYKIKCIVESEGFEPDEINLEYYLEGLKYIDLVYNDESKYNYDIKSFYILFSKRLGIKIK